MLSTDYAMLMIIISNLHDALTLVKTKVRQPTTFYDNFLIELQKWTSKSDEFQDLLQKNIKSQFLALLKMII